MRSKSSSSNLTESLQLLQEPAAQELTAQDLFGLLETATKSHKHQTAAALQALPGFNHWAKQRC
jgi:hypothetical protein